MTNLEVVSSHQAARDSIQDKNVTWSKNKQWVFLLGGFCLGVGLSVAIFTFVFGKHEVKKENEVNNYRSSLNIDLLEPEGILKGDGSSVESSVCRTDDCLKTSFLLLRSINFSVDPCDDFYEFTCGRWIAENPIPPSSSKWSHFSMLDHQANEITREILTSPINKDDPEALNQAKEFYAACVDLDELDRVGLEPVYKILEKYGGWPILYDDDTWDASNFNWMISAADLKRVFSTSAIFDIVVNQNFLNSSLNSVHLNQPSLFLSRPFLLDKEKYPEYIPAYRTFIADVASELKHYMNKNHNNIIGNNTSSKLNDVNRTYLEDTADEIIELEAMIANVTRDAQEQHYSKDLSASVSLNFLQGVFSNYTFENATVRISLKQLVDQLFSSSGVEVDNDQLISMSDVHFIGNIFEVLVSTPEETLANYLHFRMAAWLVSGTTKAMREHVLKYHKAIYGFTEGTKREYTCGASTEEKFGLAIGYKFVEKAVNRETKLEIEEVFEDLRASFKNLLKESEWLDEETRNFSSRRINSVKGCIGFPDWIDNKTAIDNYYDGLDMGIGGYFEKLLNLKTWQSDKKLKGLKEEFNPECRWNFPGQIGAYYDVRRKAVSLPAGVLQLPFYSKNRPESLNYGGIGTIIGHEITHGFTIAGWTQDTDGNFTDVSNCLIDQYNRFEVTEINAKLNGKLTLDENFPDNGGLHESYFAFLEYFNQHGPEEKLPGLENFNSEKLFFISFANTWCSSTRPQPLLDQILTDHHSPARYRVLGTLRNFPEFSSTWDCPIGSNMNPNPEKTNKCSVF